MMAQGRWSFTRIESSEQLSQTPLAKLQCRLRLAHLVARLVGSPHGQDYEHDRQLKASSTRRISLASMVLGFTSRVSGRYPRTSRDPVTAAAPS
jgi:hypothetical protein